MEQPGAGENVVGAVVVNGAWVANGNVVANGAVVANGNVVANGAVVANGDGVAHGAVVANGAAVAHGVVVANGAVAGGAAGNSSLSIRLRNYLEWLSTRWPGDNNIGGVAHGVDAGHTDLRALSVTVNLLRQLEQGDPAAVVEFMNRFFAGGIPSLSIRLRNYLEWLSNRSPDDNLIGGVALGVALGVDAGDTDLRALSATVNLLRELEQDDAGAMVEFMSRFFAGDIPWNIAGV